MNWETALKLMLSGSFIALEGWPEHKYFRMDQYQNLALVDHSNGMCNCKKTSFTIENLIVAEANHSSFSLFGIFYSNREDFYIVDQEDTEVQTDADNYSGASFTIISMDEIDELLSMSMLTGGTTKTETSSVTMSFDKVVLDGVVYEMHMNNQSGHLQIKVSGEILNIPMVDIARNCSTPEQMKNYVAEGIKQLNQKIKSSATGLQALVNQYTIEYKNETYDIKNKKPSKAFRAEPFSLRKKKWE